MVQISSQAYFRLIEEMCWPCATSIVGIVKCGNMERKDQDTCR